MTLLSTLLGAWAKARCRCVWADVRCPNPATREDGLCDWCGTRRPEDLQNNPNAMLDPITGEFLGLGGRGEAHISGMAGIPLDRTPDACWMQDSGREVLS